MCASALRLVCVSLLLSTSLGCYQCFVDLKVTNDLCQGYMENDIQNVHGCFMKLDRMFNKNERVIDAGKVGPGHDTQLKELLYAEILPISQEFSNTQNTETVYEERLQRAADNFIAAASRLPRGVSGCIPPCGFQSAGSVYDCVTCQYDSCELPLDCPVEEMNVIENSRSQMLCHVAFQLPSDIRVTWRFADEAKTQQLKLFDELTEGVDMLYSIPSVRLHHEGTYQCEINSGQRTIVRLYFYLRVTRRDLTGHRELQERFELSLLPGGQLHSVTPPPSVSSSSPLLMACFTAVLLMLFLSLGCA